MYTAAPSPRLTPISDGARQGATLVLYSILPHDTGRWAGAMVRPRNHEAVEGELQQINSCRTQTS